MAIPQGLIIELPYEEPAILFPSVLPKEMKAYVHTKTCTHMLMAALFIIDKRKKYSNPHQLMNGYAKCSIVYLCNGIVFGPKKE